MTILSSDLVGYRRIWSDVVGLSSNRLSIGGSIQGVSAEILSFKISWQAQCLVRLERWLYCLHALEMRLHMWRRSLMTLHFAWQAQYLVRLQGAFACSAHWKWGCICDADHWWLAFCVAGAAVGEVAGCLLLLRALEMTFHMWRRSLMSCICEAGAVFGEVAGCLSLLPALEMTFST